MPLESNDLLALAIKAKQYAREYIIKGSSQLENNELDERRFSDLKISVDDVRALAVKQLFQQQHDPLMIENPFVLDYQNKVNIAKDFSLGNCHELALLALDYFLTNSDNLSPDIKASVYRIEGGNHIFLVIGTGDLSSPNGWNDDTYICDPWSNLVYKAAQYHDKLNNYYFDSAKKKNMTEPFDATKHRLEPTDNQNLDFLKIKQHKSELNARFNMRINKTISVLNNYKQQLTALQAPNTPNNIKTIIKNKETQINNIIDRFSSMLTHDNAVSESNLNYHALNQILRAKLKEIHQESLAAMTFSTADIAIYQHHKSSLNKLSNLIVAVNLQLEPLLLELPALPKVERTFSSFKSTVTQFLDSKKNQLTEKINPSQLPKKAKKTFPQALKNLYDELKKDNTGSLFNVTFKDTLIDYAFASYHETKSLTKQDFNSLLAALRQATDTKPELKDDINHLVDDMGELFNLKSRALKAQASPHKEKNIMGEILDKNILIKTMEIKEKLASISEQLSSKSANKIA